ncbi:hypothetical protein C8R48DRAFT_834945 [Suillus tomentosus]|nr:hypothetical protein C8R48DRAFT_834945 [Suillus tomentosus]
MQAIVDALVERKLISHPLPLVPFSEWLEKLESNAKDLSNECIPAIKLLNFMRSIARSDISTRASGKMGVEVAGMASCVTAVTERVSPTMKELKSLSSADVGQWVDCWVGVRMFQ